MLPLEAASGHYVLGTEPVFGLIDTDGQSWFDLPERERYNLAEDPGQLDNLYTAADGPALDGLMAKTPRRWPPEGEGGLDAATASQLAALGYLSTGGMDGGATGGDPKQRIDLMRFLMTPKFDLPLASAAEQSAALQAKYGWTPSLVEYLVEYYAGRGYRWDSDRLLAALAFLVAALAFLLGALAVLLAAGGVLVAGEAVGRGW